MFDLFPIGRIVEFRAILLVVPGHTGVFGLGDPLAVTRVFGAITMASLALHILQVDLGGFAEPVLVHVAGGVATQAFRLVALTLVADRGKSRAML